MLPNLSERVASRAVGEHISRKIREGDPDTGWEGDPFLVLTYDPDGYYRVWDTVNGYPDLVCQRLSDGRELDTRSLTAGLARASLNRNSVEDILAGHQKNNDYIDEQADKAQRERIAEQSERVAYEIARSDV
jgi:hypothetical protein